MKRSDASSAIHNVTPRWSHVYVILANFTTKNFGLDSPQLLTMWKSSLIFSIARVIRATGETVRKMIRQRYVRTLPVVFHILSVLQQCLQLPCLMIDNRIAVVANGKIYRTNRVKSMKMYCKELERMQLNNAFAFAKKIRFFLYTNCVVTIVSVANCLTNREIIFSKTSESVN